MTIPPILRNRLVVGAIVFGVLAGSVGIARAIGGSNRPAASTSTAPVLTSPPPTADTTAVPRPATQPPDTTTPQHDDGVATEAPAGPAVSAGPAGLSPAGEKARLFSVAWCTHQNVSAEAWRNGLAPHATPRLMDRLKDTDPVNVPASSVTGAVVTHTAGESYEIAAVPVDTGLLTLRVLGNGDTWYVDSVDWERS